MDSREQTQDPVLARYRQSERMAKGSRKLLDAALADKEAFSDIVEHTKAMTYAIAYGFFRNRTMAEDLAQDAYLALFSNLHKLDSDLHLVNWLRQTVTRKCIDYTRRKKHQPHLDLDSIPEQFVGPVEGDPIMSVELTRKVCELPVKMRMVVVLRFQEDLKLAEIANALGIPLNTVKTLLRRALIRLRPKVAHLRTEVAYASSSAQ